MASLMRPLKMPRTPANSSASACSKPASRIAAGTSSPCWSREAHLDPQLHGLRGGLLALLGGRGHWPASRPSRRCAAPTAAPSASPAPVRPRSASRVAAPVGDARRRPPPHRPASAGRTHGPAAGRGRPCRPHRIALISTAERPAGGEALVREHDPLRPAGGPRRVDDQAGIVGIHLCRTALPASSASSPPCPAPLRPRPSTPCPGASAVDDQHMVPARATRRAPCRSSPPARRPHRRSPWPRSRRPPTRTPAGEFDGYTGTTTAPAVEAARSAMRELEPGVAEDARRGRPPRRPAPPDRAPDRAPGSTAPRR